ncbi:transcriptional adapter 2-alpha-like [Liolophura sinensis]|uniref:transcriptional adapter 2-alpha-like n=1 Tax=Liolophura sinensis TaxID=3198878 RepID=UPI00315982A8
MFEEEDDYKTCLGCNTTLSEPYIRCGVCMTPTTLLCLHCFAQGFENDSHYSNHDYEIIKTDFALFEDHWTAAEESDLLKAVSDCGLGNWADIAAQISSKSPEECERHYTHCYINHPATPLPAFPEPEFQPKPLPIVFKLSDDPPRPLESSALCIEMAGYMAARSEFTSEHDNFVELDLRNITLEENEEDILEEQLKLAALQVYQSCLMERHRRKRIVRSYGLINYKKLSVHERRFEKTLRRYMDPLRAVMRLVPPSDFDKYLEGFNYKEELKREVEHLQEFRENGLTQLRHMKVYNHLKLRRELERSKRHMLSDILDHIQDETACQSWLQKQAALSNGVKYFPVTHPSVPRKSAPPLDIVGLPGFEKLNEEEKELCSSVRLVPEAYNEFKSILVAECKKVGSLKLAQARALIKIDVNKTRRLYDFLLSQGVIRKDSI